MLSILLELENCDVFLGAFGYTEKRNKIVDLLLPTRVTSMALLIPKPTKQDRNYALAVISPFRIEVLYKNKT